MTRPDHTLPATPEARALARELWQGQRHASLAVTDPVTLSPGISRIAWGLAPDGAALTLVSSLAPHFAALAAHPVCAAMLGEPGPRGDPLTHPRLMIRLAAAFVAADAPERGTLRDRWLADHPKAALYADFADFSLVRLTPLSALLNAGFGRAFRLDPADLAS